MKTISDLLSTCPRKMTFENVMKMISEYLRLQEIKALCNVESFVENKVKKFPVFFPVFCYKNKN